MTPDDEILCNEMAEAYERDGDMLIKNAAAAIERLSAEVAEAEKSLGIKQHYVDQLAKELAALRTQIAETQKQEPVAWRTDIRGRNVYSTYKPAEIVDSNPVPLYAHPAADAKDAERYRWLRDRIYIDSMQKIIRVADLILPKNSMPESFDAAIDTAMAPADDWPRGSLGEDVLTEGGNK